MKPRLSQVDELILREVYLRGAVRSLSALALEHLLDYSNARERVRRLEAGGLVIVARDRAAWCQPLVISRPAHTARQLAFALPSQACDGIKVRRGQ